MPLLNLPAKGSQVLNLKEVVIAGTPDENGSVIPSGTTFGTLLLEVTDKSSQDFILGGATTFDPVKGGYGIFIDPGCGDFCSTCEDCEDFGSGFECVPSCDNAACCPPPLPQPQISSITPNQAPIGTTSVLVTLKGVFNANPRISISGSTITAGSASFDQSGNLTATFTISNSAVVGGFLIVEEDDGGQSNVVTFALAPRVDSVNPAKGLIAAPVQVTITGQGFGTNPTLSAGANISISNISPVSDTQIKATFTPSSSANASGNQAVTVTNQNITSASQSFYNQVPSSLTVLSVIVLPDGPDPPSGCPGSLPYGIKVDIQYQVWDQNTPPSAIQSTAMTPHEHGTFFSGGTFDGPIGPAPGYPTSSATTAPDGTFHDVPVGKCSNLPISSGTATQNITMILPDGTSSPIVRSQGLTVLAPGAVSFGHGTISNSINSPGSGSDINAKR